MQTYEQSLHALSDPTRRRVLEGLRAGPRSVGDLARGMPVSRPAVSQHLGVLKGAGLVSERRVGTRRLYAAEPEGLAGLREWLEGFWSDVLGAYERAARDAAANESGDGETAAADPAKEDRDD